MNLKQSLVAEALNTPQPQAPCPCDEVKVSALQMARNIFAVAMENGNPFQKLTFKQWAEHWLVSPEFVLTEIPVSAVAIPSIPYNTNKVLAHMHASVDSLPPIVVDLNKRGVGRSPTSGYVPPIVVVDGKHRATALTMQGRATFKAWVGVNALKFIKPTKVTIADTSFQTRQPLTKLDAAAQLHAAIASGPVPRQDVGDGGSAPTMRMPSVKSTGVTMEPFTKAQKPEVKAFGGGGGATGGPGGSTSGLNPMRKGFEARTNPGQHPGTGEHHPSYGTGKSRMGFTKKVKADGDASDKKSVIDPSDQDYPPDPSDQKNSPAVQSPGSGVGPRLKPSTGASRSEYSRMGFPTAKPKGGASRSDLSKVMGAALKSCKGCADVKKMMSDGTFVKKIVTDFRAACKGGYKAKMEAVSPSGCEHVVKGLKKSGQDKDSAYAIAWWMHNEGRC